MTEMQPKPRYSRIGPYVVSLDYIHGIVSVKTENKEFPYQIIITYTNGQAVCLECPSQEESQNGMAKIALELGAT